MKGADTDSFSCIALELFGNSFFHLSSSLVSKGYGIDMTRLYTCFVDQMCNLMGDYRGFSAACASQHQKRAVIGCNSLLLLFVELGQLRISDNEEGDKCEEGF